MVPSAPPRLTPEHLLAPQPRRLAPIPRTPSPGAAWSRYPDMQDVPWLLSPGPSVGPSPVPSPDMAPVVYELGIPLRRLPSTCQLAPARRGADMSGRLEAEPIDEPPRDGTRAFVWTLRIFFGALVLAIPAALVWFGLRSRANHT